MTKRTIKETVREFDKDGKLIKETITETVEDDDTQYYPSYPINTPAIIYQIGDTKSWWQDGPTCTSECHKEET